MKKALRVLLVMCLLLAFGVTASATCKGYGNWQLSVIDRQMLNGTQPHATATIWRCSCLPVDNYLSAGVRAQYRHMNGSQYYWSPTTGYVTDWGNNVESRTVTVTITGNYLIKYAKAKFQARCGSNAMSTFYREWDGDPVESFGELEK